MGGALITACFACGDGLSRECVDRFITFVVCMCVCVCACVFVCFRKLYATTIVEFKQWLSHWLQWFGVSLVYSL